VALEIGFGAAMPAVMAAGVRAECSWLLSVNGLVLEEHLPFFAVMVRRTMIVR
jgi:hypothetical protein